jgi:catechol 2,3-dioxygenase-like lactoylglutathione lyase family enzyme
MHALLTHALVALLGQDAPPVGPPAVYALELPVRDVRASERAWVDGFGCRVLYSGGEMARLALDGLELVLVRSDAPPASADAAGVHLNLEARDLGLALERTLAAGLEVPELEPIAIPIGRALCVRDADGHRVNLIDLDPAAGAGDDALMLFNVGLALEADADWEFVERLGLRVLTRAFEPHALPVEKSGAAELVLRRTALAPRAPGTKSAALLLGVERLEPAVERLAALGFADPAVLPRATPQGRRVALRAPSGLRLELVERSPGQLAFERLCALAGSWEGRSSAGWTSRCELEVIARGSALLERTNFEAHPGETMLTLFHKDGSELLLTHYCVAGNQPRLVASEIAGDTLRFTFRDATNLADSTQGHMGAALFRLEGPDAFSSQWSFQQGGQTNWMEEIRYRRLAGR